MEPRAALVLAIVSGALAVGLVVADLNYTLSARLETKGPEGGWELVQQAPESGERYANAPRFEACAGRELRLVVDNDRPLRDAVQVVIRVTNGTGRQMTMLDETWDLDRFEERAVEFTVPEDALEGTGAGPGSPGKTDPYRRADVSIAVADHLQLWSCVSEDG